VCYDFEGTGPPASRNSPNLSRLVSFSQDLVFSFLVV
jgi:hypothetical protein